jgi:FtsH-binding integral membrane protein
MGCPNFIGLTYLHLFLGTLVSAGAAALNPLERLGIDTENLVVEILLLVFIIGLLFLTMFLKPGPLKYLVFVIFVVLMGTTLRKVVERFKAKNILVDVLMTISGIFLTMTAVGFWDRQNILSFEVYLFAALIGLILGRLGFGAAMLLGAPKENLSGMSHILSIIGTLIFSIYVAYDTQVLKEDARKCKGHPDYINSALGLYLDIVNLFVNTGDLMDN